MTEGKSFLGRLLCGLGHLALAGGLLLHALDDSDSHGLLHVTHSETTKRRVVGEALDAHGFAGDHLNYGGVTGLQVLGVVLKLLAGTTVDLLLELGEFAGDVSGVAIQHRCVSSADLTGVVQDDDLMRDTKFRLVKKEKPIKVAKKKKKRNQ